MFPSELLTANKKIMHVYESFCTPLCKKYQLNQSDLDLILFIANNPMYNTAKDVCEIRGIKKRHCLGNNGTARPKRLSNQKK